MKVKVKSLDELIPYAQNSRTHSEEQILQIASSIREFGFNNPVLIDQDGGIIAGHGRVLAARNIGMNEVPVIELRHLTEMQKKAYIIADNKIAINAGWNDEILKQELEELQLNEFDLDILGFSDNELTSIMLEKEKGKTDPYEEWVGMPDYQDNELSFRKVWVNFNNEDDVNEFFSLIGQSYTSKTKSIWFPEKERKSARDYEWISKSD